MDIVLFPKIGQRSIEVHADVDEDIPYSLLQKSVLDDLQLQHKPCHEPEFISKGRTQTPIGYVDLQWHKAGVLIENTERFYVVESGRPSVALKGTGNEDTDNGVRPVGIGAQTSGMA